MVSPAELAEITEVKETLRGERKTFRCRVLDRAPGGLVVLFVSERPYRVAELDLPAGTITFGYFWVGRGYNVYHWMTPTGGTLAHYVNLADRTRIDEAIAWRDLAVDVLLWPDGRAQILDLEELPRDLAPLALDRQAQAIVEGGPALRAELEARSSALWPRAFGGPR